MKTVRVILSPEAEEVYTHLNKMARTSKADHMILKAINKKINMIKTENTLSSFTQFFCLDEREHPLSG